MENILESIQSRNQSRIEKGTQYNLVWFGGKFHNFYRIITFFILGLGFAYYMQVFTTQSHAEFPKSPSEKIIPEQKFVPGQLFILFRKGTEPERIQMIHEALKVKVLRTFLNGEITLVEIPKEKTIEKLKEEYESYPEVKAVNLNYRIQLQEENL